MADMRVLFRARRQTLAPRANAPAEQLALAQWVLDEGFQTKTAAPNGNGRRPQVSQIAGIRPGPSGGAMRGGML